MFGSLGAPELAIIAVVVILLFGVGRLSGVGRDLGTSIKEFRRAMKDPDDDQQESIAAQIATGESPMPPAEADEQHAPAQQRDGNIF